MWQANIAHFLFPDEKFNHPSITCQTFAFISMAKARKEQFEDQLRDLQKDISSLSHKLAIPPTSINSHSYANRGQKALQMQVLSA